MKSVKNPVEQQGLKNSHVRTQIINFTELKWVYWFQSVICVYHLSVDTFLCRTEPFFLSLGPMVTVISKSVFNLFLSILFKTNNKPSYNSYDNHVIYTDFSGPLVGYIP